MIAINHMFAVLRTGGKQYRVAPGDVIRVEKLAGAQGGEIAFGEILAMGGRGDTHVGAPLVSGARVSAEILEQTKGPKLLSFEKRRRKHSRRVRGHRQELTVLRIMEIVAPDGTSAKAETKAKPARTPAADGGDAPGEHAAPAKKKAAAKTATVKKAPAKKSPAKKTPAKKAGAKKTGAKKKS